MNLSRAHTLWTRPPPDLLTRPWDHRLRCPRGPAALTSPGGGSDVWTELTHSRVVRRHALDFSIRPFLLFSRTLFFALLFLSLSVSGCATEPLPCESPARCAERRGGKVKGVSFRKSRFLWRRWSSEVCVCVGVSISFLKKCCAVLLVNYVSVLVCGLVVQRSLYMGMRGRREFFFRLCFVIKYFWGQTH